MAGRFLGVIVLAILGIPIVYFLFFSTPIKQIETPFVSENDYQISLLNEVMAIAHKTLVGHQLWSPSFAEFEKEIQQYGLVNIQKIERFPPDTLRIYFIPKQLVATIPGGFVVTEDFRVSTNSYLLQAAQYQNLPSFILGEYILKMPEHTKTQIIQKLVVAFLEIKSALISFIPPIQTVEYEPGFLSIKTKDVTIHFGIFHPSTLNESTENFSQQVGTLQKLLTEVPLDKGLTIYAAYNSGVTYSYDVIH